MALGLAVGVVIWIYLLNRSARGLALSAIRDNESLPTCPVWRYTELRSRFT